MVIRSPVVAGQFYAGSASALERQIKGYIDDKAQKEEVFGLLSPHAGYMYSGPVAGATISRIVLKDTFVMLGPNHTGRGKLFSIMTEGSWETPLGTVEIDSELGRELRRRSHLLEEDAMAHAYEHSIEVQIPFLQYFKRDVKIVPIILGPAPGSTYKEIGGAIAEAIKGLGREAVILASSDMTHYEPHESAKAKDAKAIEAILDLDEDELLNRVRSLNITMCGYGPAVCLISAAKELGAKVAELVKYQTSGDNSGDYSAVVGYAGIVIKR